MADRHRKLRYSMTKVAASAAGAGALVLGGTGIAHAWDNGSTSSGSQEAGTVQSVNGSVITLLDRAGNTDTVDTNNNTMYETQSGAAGSPSGVANGDFLVAWGTMQSDGSLLASKVRYGPANQAGDRDDTTQSNQANQSSQPNTQTSPSSQSDVSGQSGSSQAGQTSQSGDQSSPQTGGNQSSAQSNQTSSSQNSQGDDHGDDQGNSQGSSSEATPSSQSHFSSANSSGDDSDSGNRGGARHDDHHGR